MHKKSSNAAAPYAVKRASLVLTLLLCIVACSQPSARATRLPPELMATVSSAMPKSAVRLDGSIQTAEGDIYLPVILTAKAKPGVKVTLEGRFPKEGKPDFLSFSNGWTYLRVIAKNNLKTVAIPSDTPENLRQRLLSSKLPPDLIVPEGLKFPENLKALVGDVNVPIAETKPEAADGTAQDEIARSGIVLAISPAMGKVALLDESDLTKITEFPTEGTPCGVATGDGLAYIADQTKQRVLILDPKKRQFLGQMDLPAQCAPKGIALFEKAKLLYVSESATNNIAVIETATARVLMRTKVPAGPGRLLLTPDRTRLLVLNVPAGLLTIVDTASQRVLGSVATGAMPSFITVTSDSKHAFVSNRAANSIAVVDLISRKVVRRLAAGTGPTGVALNKAGDRLFVANAKDNTIWVFDLLSGQKSDEIRLPLDVDFPGELTLMPDGKRLLVASEATDAIGVFNIETLKFESQPVIGVTTDEVRWMAVK